MSNQAALQWIVGDDTGSSSEAIWSHFMGVVPAYRSSYPVDPSDFGRCARLLELVPEWRSRIVEMAQYSPEWDRLTDRWAEIHACMDAEVGIDWSKGQCAPKTYALMKEILAAPGAQEGA